MENTLASFKAYDIRGTVNSGSASDITPQLAYAIGANAARMCDAVQVVVGYDAREESPSLLNALAAGIQSAGATVLTIGQNSPLCGTEEVYAATAHFGHKLGIMVTASHNPKGYNGFKLIREEGKAFSSEDLQTLKFFVSETLHKSPETPEQPKPFTVLEGARDAYIQKVLSFIKPETLGNFTVVANAMNGSAGPTLMALANHLPTVNFIWLQETPDGSFPFGLPNPLLPSQRERTAAAVREHKADLAVAFDGDFDRCFLFTETGEFVPPYYQIGLLVESLLSANPGGTIVHDPRLYWDTLSTIEQFGGKPQITRAGHLFFKQTLRQSGAVFGAETSGHYFFQNFYCCDSGVIPFLLTLQLLSDRNITLGQAVGQKATTAPAADETNFRLVSPAPEVLEQLRAHFDEAATLDGKTVQVEQVDGMGFTFDGWRCNLRASNTEPLLRLNIEARSTKELTKQHTAVSEFLKSLGATQADH